jgi:transketolase C-terminal domain/subunit
MKILTSKILKAGFQKWVKLEKLARKHPKKSLGIAAATLIGTNLGLGVYGAKKYKKKD